MKRFVSCILAFFALISLFGTGVSESAKMPQFFIRLGLTWYMSEDEAVDLVKSEIGSEYFGFINHSDETNKLFPRAEGELWCYYIVGPTLLGPEEENVLLLLLGAKRTGLYSMGYQLLYPEGANDIPYERAKEVIKQLEKKYKVSFTQDRDNWSQKDSAKIGIILVSSRAVLEDGTTIVVDVSKDGAASYYATISYRSPDSLEIEQSFVDGSYFIDVPFGL